MQCFLLQMSQLPWVGVGQGRVLQVQAYACIKRDRFGFSKINPQPVEFRSVNIAARLDSGLAEPDPIAISMYMQLFIFFRYIGENIRLRITYYL